MSSVQVALTPLVSDIYEASHNSLYGFNFSLPDSRLEWDVKDKKQSTCQLKVDQGNGTRWEETTYSWRFERYLSTN